MGDESINDLYAAIGHTVSTWARLEKSLFRFFYTLQGLQGISLYESAAIFFAWRVFEQRLKLTDEIMQIRFDGKGELEFWNVLRSYIYALGKERNFIVHNEVNVYTRFREKGPDEIEIVSIAFSQASSPFDVQLLKKTPRELKLIDIQTVEHAITILDIYLDGFCQHIKGEPGASRDMYRGSWSAPLLENYLLPPEKRQPQTNPPQSSQA